MLGKCGSLSERQSVNVNQPLNRHQVSERQWIEHKVKLFPSKNSNTIIDSVTMQGPLLKFNYKRTFFNIPGTFLLINKLSTKYKLKNLMIALI